MEKDPESFIEAEIDKTPIDIIPPKNAIKQVKHMSLFDIHIIMSFTAFLLFITCIVLFMLVIILPKGKVHQDIKLVSFGFAGCLFFLLILQVFIFLGNKIKILRDIHNRYVASITAKKLCERIATIIMFITLAMIAYIVYIVVALKYEQ